MTASRASRAAAAALLWLLAAPAASAQAPAAGLQPVAPVPLEPLEPAAPPAPAAPAEAAPAPAPQAAPQRLVPRRLIPQRATPAPEPNPEPAPETAAPAGNGLLPLPVASDALGAVDPDSLGVLSADAGGFGPDLWDGVDRAQVRALLADMPGRYRNAALRGIAQRLLLTAAPAPAAGPNGAPDAPGLLQLRLDALMAMGAVDDARRLLDTVPQGRMDAALIALRIDLMLLANTLDDACALTSQELERHPTPPLRRAAILCQARSGQTAASAFGLTLLRDEGLTDPYFAALIGRIGDPAAAPVAVDEAVTPASLTPLHLAAMRTAGAAPPATVLEIAAPAVLASLATSGPGAPADRLAAGMRAAAMGALDSDALASLFATYPLTEDDLARPISRAAELPPAEALALLYRAAESQTVKAARAEAMLTAMRQADGSGDLPVVARLLAPLASDMTPAPELSWFAPAAARLALLNGDLPGADDWIAIADPPEADRPADRPGLMLARQLADPTAPPATAAARAWAAAKQDASAVAGLFALLDALGRAEPADLWRAAPLTAQAAPAAMPVAAWHRVALARDKGHVGETVLLALLLAGGETPPPMAFARGLAALSAIGLADEAAAAALEAALGGGL